MQPIGRCVGLVNEQSGNQGKKKRHSELEEKSSLSPTSVSAKVNTAQVSRGGKRSRSLTGGKRDRFVCMIFGRASPESSPVPSAMAHGGDSPTTSKRISTLFTTRFPLAIYHPGGLC